jgi:dihydrofolate reductase
VAGCSVVIGLGSLQWVAIIGGETGLGKRRSFAAMSFGSLIGQPEGSRPVGGVGMRKVVVGMLLSLDGVAEAPNTFFGWDDAVDASIPRLIATQDAVILGRHTFDEWVGFWPGSDVEPFASFINGATKYVATSTPLDPEWANATVIDGELVEFARDLKQQPGGDIGVHGSISVAQALLAADLVDELRLAIGPMIAGRGRRLLDGLPSMQLESIRSEVSPTGYLLVDYRVTR